MTHAAYYHPNAYKEAVHITTATTFNKAIRVQSLCESLSVYESNFSGPQTQRFRVSVKHSNTGQSSHMVKCHPAPETYLQRLQRN